MFQLNLKKPLVIFDLETTGTNIIKDRIVEFAFIKIMPNDGKKEVRVQRINPTIPIPEKSSSFHGIYDEDIKDAPTFKQVAKELAVFLEGVDLCGFNIIRFDIPLLVEEFLRAEVEFSIEKRRLIDAQKIFNIMEPRSLTAAYNFYCDKNLEDAHTASADAEATFEVLKAQVKKYEGMKIKDINGKEFVPIENDMDKLHQLGTSNIVDLAGRMVLNENGVEVFNFGKYKGQEVVEVFKKDPNYYDWMQKSEFPLDTKRKLLQIKLKTIQFK